MTLAETPTVDQRSPSRVGAFDENARHRVGAALEHADAIIDEPNVLDEALIGAEILAQREIERVDGAIAFGGGNRGSRHRH